MIFPLEVPRALIPKILGKTLCSLFDIKTPFKPTKTIVHTGLDPQWHGGKMLTLAPMGNTLSVLVTAHILIYKAENVKVALA
jgi:hypothetical protein